MCEHERLRTVGDDVFCCICGEHLPLEFLMNKGKPAKAPEKKPEEIPATAEEAKPAKKKAPAKKTTKKTEEN